ncbi:MAG: ABC transporter substrate-binding protein [Fibrobacterota bacterium]
MLRFSSFVVDTLFAACFLFLFSSCEKKPQVIQDATPSKIVSFAPSITETLFALGLDQRVAGVTRFCSYPSAVSELPRVGGYTDPNYEALLRISPDLVIVLREHDKLIRFLDKHSIRHLTVSNESVEEIVESFRMIARVCDVEKRGDSLAGTVERRFGTGGEKEDRPSVLLCVDREAPGSGRIAKVFAAGPRSFYNDIIEASGGDNVLRDSLQSYMALSLEGIVRFSPDIIIDISASYRKDLPGGMEQDWAVLKGVDAVDKGEVHCLVGDYLTVPGPRIRLVLEQFSSIVSDWRERAGNAGEDTDVDD